MAKYKPVSVRVDKAAWERFVAICREKGSNASEKIRWFVSKVNEMNPQ